ncbi:hypothetical protein P3W85_40470 [Cupriavidus basilensis]|uniref:Uncharacterized protein n=1 Tax=Cupriavidus basilensis TaxID=68895 RepID=A0ABT6B359_9BURK|nr:hypothetical protein [Cupriavidus basilensis]MDF3839169.1 hypothetical protein [Cupriavidus basilensis]
MVNGDLRITLQWESVGQSQRGWPGARGRSAGIPRLSQLIERVRLEVGDVRRLLAQAELWLDAVPCLEAELVNACTQVAAEAVARVAAEKSAAVADANRVAAQAAQQQAESRLTHSEERGERTPYVNHGILFRDYSWSQFSTLTPG